VDGKGGTAAEFDGVGGLMRRRPIACNLEFMRLAVTLLGVIAVVVGVALSFVPAVAGGGGVATPAAPFVIQTPGGIGPVAINVVWSGLSPGSQIEVASCPVGSVPPTAACPRFNLLGPDNTTYGYPTYGSLSANVPAGTQVVVVVTGPTGASSGVVVSAADPTFGAIVVAIGVAVVGVGVWLKAGRARTVEEPPPGQRLASDSSSGTPSVAPRSSKGRL
jgi:hypothetical protein